MLCQGWPQTKFCGPGSCALTATILSAGLPNPNRGRFWTCVGRRNAETSGSSPPDTRPRSSTQCGDAACSAAAAPRPRQLSSGLLRPQGPLFREVWRLPSLASHRLEAQHRRRSACFIPPEFRDDWVAELSAVCSNCRIYLAPARLSIICGAQIHKILGLCYRYKEAPPWEVSRSASKCPLRVAPAQPGPG